jgi:hypothetical protein
MAVCPKCGSQFFQLYSRVPIRRSVVPPRLRCSIRSSGPARLKGRAVRVLINLPIDFNVKAE